MNEIWVWKIGGIILKWTAELFGERPVRMQLRTPPGIEKNHLSHGTALLVSTHAIQE